MKINYVDFELEQQFGRHALSRNAKEMVEMSE
jgi:hypothetical protein